MLKPVLQEALNKQLNAELYSAYLYWSMAAYFRSQSLDGFANWMQVQAQEELTHAEKFFNYINDRGGRVLLAPIDGPETEWESPLHVFEAALGHERKITGLIEDLVTLSMEEKDYGTQNFLQWFVAEQMEEEASVDTVLQQLRLVGEAKSGLFMLDREMGQRTLTTTDTQGE